MKAWTYPSAPRRGPYWRSTADGPVVCLEHPDGCLEWRRASNGTVATGLVPPGVHHKGQLLRVDAYPAWLSDLDDLGMDVGL